MRGRCNVTGNPCGTDTWEKGRTCPCDACQKWLRETAPGGEAGAPPCPSCGSTEKFHWRGENGCWTAPPEPKSAQPAAEPGSAELSINEATRLIKKLEACEGMPGKLLVLRHACETYTASLSQRVRELEAEREQWITSDAFNWRVRAETAERELAEAREALEKIRRFAGGTMINGKTVRSMAEAALRRTGEKFV